MDPVCNNCIRCCRAPDFGDHSYCNSCACGKESARFAPRDYCYSGMTGGGAAAAAEAQHQPGRTSTRNAEKEAMGKVEEASRDKMYREKDRK